MLSDLGTDKNALSFLVRLAECQVASKTGIRQKRSATEARQPDCPPRRGRGTVEAVRSSSEDYPISTAWDDGGSSASLPQAAKA